MNDDDLQDFEVMDEMEDVVEQQQTGDSTQEKTLEELLPQDCIVISMEDGNLDPLVSVRGRYLDDLGEAASFLRLALAKIQYYKYVQDRS